MSSDDDWLQTTAQSSDGRNDWFQTLSRARSASNIDTRPGDGDLEESWLPERTLESCAIIVATAASRQEEAHMNYIRDVAVPPGGTHTRRIRFQFSSAADSSLTTRKRPAAYSNRCVEKDPYGDLGKHMLYPT
eukprot:8090906-Pyramimonas_sp.AAC.1